MKRMMKMVTDVCFWSLYGVGWWGLVAHIPQHQVDCLLIVRTNLPRTHS